MNSLSLAHDAGVQMIDTSIIRVHQHGAFITRNRRQSMGRSRGGLTSKIHAVVDTNGLPVRLALTAGEAHDNRLAGRLLSRLKSGTMLLADRGYDADWIRALASKRGEHSTEMQSQRAICFSPYLYRARNLVERFFNRIKRCRRVATRYDKLAAHYLAFVSIRLWLRVNEFTSQSTNHSRPCLRGKIRHRFAAPFCLSGTGMKMPSSVAFSTIRFRNSSRVSSLSLLAFGSLAILIVANLAR